MSHDTTTLPKWAQSRIEVAENRAEYWRKQIHKAEVGHTEVFVQQYPNEDVGLPPGSMISFKLQTIDGEETGRYDVRMTEKGTLEIRGVGRRMSDQLRTIHRSSNVFEVDMIPWNQR